MSLVFNKYFENKKVLITGHTGFKGSWLALWLNALGADVIGYALDPPSIPNNFTANVLEDKITHIHGDIRDIEFLIDAFHTHQPEFVFHLAAQALVRYSYKDPKLTFDTNVGGTVNVMEAVRQTPSVKVLVNITSDKCYENKEWIWGYRENDQLGGHDPYSASKGCSELIFNAYMNSFFGQDNSNGRALGAAATRAGNVIGGGDWGADRLIPDCIRSLFINKPIGIRNPQAIRPWQHVLEPLGGYLLLGALLWKDPKRYSGVWNFGPDLCNHLTVAEVVERLITLWCTGTWEDLSDPKSLHETNLLKLNCDKAKGYLDWHGVLSIDECLEMSAAWYKRFYTKSQEQDMYEFSLSQIQQYGEKLKGFKSL